MGFESGKSQSAQGATRPSGTVFPWFNIPPLALSIFRTISVLCSVSDSGLCETIVLISFGSPISD